MAKTKRRHLAAIAAKKDANPVDGKNKSSPLPGQETDFQEDENSWVHVRKQRVIIWIPPLPAATQDTVQAESIKQKEIEQRAPAGSAGRISRKRSKNESTAIQRRKRSRIDSTANSKNASRNIRKAIFKVRSRQGGRKLVGKKNAELNQDALPLRLPRTKSAAVQKEVAQGASKIVSHSSIQQDKEQKSVDRESMPTTGAGCKVLSQESLQVPGGETSHTVQKNQNSSEHSGQHEYQRRDIEVDNATKGDLDDQHKPKEARMGNQLPPSKDGASYGLERNCQNSDEPEAMKSTDTHPEELAKPVPLPPVSLVPNESRLLDRIKLKQRTTGFDKPAIGPSSSLSKKFFEQRNSQYDPRCMTSLQHGVSLVNNSKILASERISSAAMHLKFSQGASAYMNETGETNIFGSNNYVNIPLLDNQSKRVLILRKNLAKAGGLRRWLVSKGLAQFVDIFQREKVDEFCLLQLTMATLKEMGAYAVGPRRKLIHAIDCLSQPYNFRAF